MPDRAPGVNCCVRFVPFVFYPFFYFFRNVEPVPRRWHEEKEILHAHVIDQHGVQAAVANYLPSVSAAIGGHTPQRYIWRFGIALHSAPRILISAMYHRYYQNMLDTQHQYVARIAFWINVAEILTLLGLSNVTSTENYAVHEKMFVTFLLCSLMYMILCCVIPSLGRRRSLSGLEAYSLKVKKQLTTMSVILSLLCTFFFVRHTTHCEPGRTTAAIESRCLIGCATERKILEQEHQHSPSLNVLRVTGHLHISRKPKNCH
ncbi:acyltransferase PGAP2-like isoform X3 [Dermacentor variabilis]|uniref:acyltransferase PGAP2-like isoform X3 n=1 Tax=Dermacentor variabilis TaxID=34621 RepID=UPI003F5C9AF0